MEKSDFTAVSTAENNTEIAELKARVSELETLVKYYEEQFRISKHRQFGASSEKSEYDFTQLSIFNEAELFADANVTSRNLSRLRSITVNGHGSRRINFRRICLLKSWNMACRNLSRFARNAAGRFMFLDGRLEISNNRAERSIKPFVIDRKNFLFSNTPRGAKVSAVMFSLIETAKENGLNPYEYLVYVFKNAPNLNIRNDIDALWSLSPTTDSSHFSLHPSRTSLL